MTTTIIEKLMIMHELTKKELSECMGITLKSLEDKLKYKEKWNSEDIDSIAAIFYLMPWQVELIFSSNLITDTQRKMRKIWVKSIDYLINRINYN